MFSILYSFAYCCNRLHLLFFMCYGVKHSKAMYRNSRGEHAFPPMASSFFKVQCTKKRTTRNWTNRCGDFHMFPPFLLRIIVVYDNEGTVVPRLVSAMRLSLGWCIVQQRGRQRGFANSLWKYVSPLASTFVLIRAGCTWTQSYVSKTWSPDKGGTC